MDKPRSYTKAISDISLAPCKYVLLVSVLGVFFGIDFGFVISNHNVLISFYSLKEGDINVIVGSFLLGVLLGIFLGGMVVYTSGRKICMLGGVAFGLAALFSSALAPNFSLLLLAQVVVGFSFAIYLLATSLYVNEITASSNRGFCVIMVWVFLTAGVMLSTFIHWVKPMDSSFVYFVVFGAVILFATVISFFYLPESPRWLSFSGYPDAALSTLFKLRKDMGIAARELADINESCSVEDSGMEFFLQNANYRRPIWLMLVMGVLLHLGGIIFVPYAILDLIDTGFRTYPIYAVYKDGTVHQALVTSIFAGAVSAACLTDRMGRSNAMFYSAMLALMALLVLFGISMYDTGKITSGIILGIIIVYSFASVFFLCVLLPLVANEILPMKGREFGFCVILFANVVLILFGFRSYNYIIDALGYSGYYLLCVLSFACLLYIVRRFVPNTVNNSLEGIQTRLLSGISLRDLGKAAR